MNVGVILAAGNNTRFDKKESKLFAKINGKPVIYYSFKAFEENKDIDYVLLVTKMNGQKEFLPIINKYDFEKIQFFATGGATRQESVHHALMVLAMMIEDNDKVIIHDAARPFITKEHISSILNALKTYKGATTAIKIDDTIARVNDNNVISENINRENLYRIQTPQGFRFKELLDAHTKFKNEKNATDDASMLQKMNIKVAIVPGSKDLMKITTKEDLKFLKRLAGDE